MSRIVFPHHGTTASTIPHVMSRYHDVDVIPGLRLHKGDPAATEASLIAWMTGRDTDLRDVLLVDAGVLVHEQDGQKVGKVGRTMMPTIAERVLRVADIDPRTYAVLMLVEPGSINIGDMVMETVCERRRIRSTPEDYRIHLEPAYSLQCSAILPGGISWNVNAHVIDIPELLPQTIMTAMMDQPLRRLISHPFLDALDLGIDDIFHDGTGTTVYCDHLVERVCLDDIAPLS